MSKRPRLGSEKDSEETGNEGKDGDEAVLEWIAEDRESKRRAELRMKLGAEDLFQALKQEEGARSRVTISGSGGKKTIIEYTRTNRHERRTVGHRARNFPEWTRLTNRQTDTN